MKKRALIPIMLTNGDEHGDRIALSLADVRLARERIHPHVHRTPILTNKFLDKASGLKLFFKCENFQKTGAFKARGAANAVIRGKWFSL